MRPLSPLDTCMSASTFSRGFCVYAIMTKISPRVNVGPNKHVDTNDENNEEIIFFLRFEHVTFEFQTHPSHRMASNELTIAKT